MRSANNGVIKKVILIYSNLTVLIKTIIKLRVLGTRKTELIAGMNQKLLSTWMRSTLRDAIEAKSLATMY